MCFRFIFVLIFYSTLFKLNQSLPFKKSGCGKQHLSRNSRVVGGNDTYVGEFPWTVSIRKNGDHHCGGVIIAKRWILTAAHCVQKRSPSNFIARIGEFNLNKPDYHSHDYSIEKVIIHNEYTGIVKSNTVNKADIALLKTVEPIVFNEYAWPVCVPSEEVNFENKEAVVVGWGKLSEKSDAYSEILQKVKLSIVDNQVCQKWYHSVGRMIPIHDQVICAGYKNGGRDACHGDSGGPLLYKLSDHWAVIGIVSTGIGCARPFLPGLYSRVSSYVDWILSYLSEE